MPMAYETWTRARRHSLAATRDLAIHLAAYAPERSTYKQYGTSDLENCNA